MVLVDKNTSPWRGKALA